MNEDMVPPNNYVYWVSYGFNAGNSTGIGACRVFTSIPADSVRWVNLVMEYIRERDHFVDVALINWIRLESDEIWNASN